MAISITVTFGIGYLLEEKKYRCSSLGGMKRVTIQHFQSNRPYRASLRMKNSALLLYAQVQTDWVDTIVGREHFLNHARAAQE
jgi:hypothetical protein